MAFSHHKVTVILRSVDKADTVPERNLLLRPGVSILVGRASKNEAKGMVASSDNAYIDSPVVSRKHAELTADFSGPSPLVYIADKDSMHGTKLNGNVLSDGRPRQLQSGDVLQFGADVVRDNGKPCCPGALPKTD
jgi:pSer/pThr/pTyr-binding forkhead associated (FHA) protein